MRKQWRRSADLSGKNKGADQLRSYCEADLHLYFRLGNNPVFSRRSSFLKHIKDLLSGVGSSPTLATCETSQVLLAGVPGVFFSGVLPFSPTY